MLKPNNSFVANNTQEGGSFHLSLSKSILRKFHFSSSIQRCSSRRKVSDDHNNRVRMSELDAVYQNKIKDGCRKKVYSTKNPCQSSSFSPKKPVIEANRLNKPEFFKF